MPRRGRATETELERDGNGLRVRAWAPVRLKYAAGDTGRQCGAFMKPAPELDFRM